MQGLEMLNIEAVNHIGIRIADKSRAVEFYQLLGFEFSGDAGFEEGHPIIMRHPGGVVVNLLGPSDQKEGENILMDVVELYSGITHVALTVSSIAHARQFMRDNNIEETGSFSFGGMSAVFMRDPDRNVIELDAYEREADDRGDYSDHP
jgi:catechol 2,3-dioxygenase-like lactoylglutathione lyase family enzyme